MATKLFSLLLLITLLFLSTATTTSLASDEAKEALTNCNAASAGECYDKPKSLRLKLIAIPTILVASMIGVCLPLFTRSIPALSPDRNLFVIVKAFASGVILATGYMHVLPDSFDNLSSPCLPEKPWSQFPFATFVAMLAALATLMMDSMMMSFFSRRKGGRASAEVSSIMSPDEQVVAHALVHGHGHGQGLQAIGNKDLEASTLQRNRIIAQVLEMGIVVHSVVIGLSTGASQNPCTIRPLVAALCFHQLFEGMGLGGSVGRRWRGQVGNCGFLFFTIGFLSLPLIAYPSRHSWRNIYRIISFLPLAYSIFLTPFISESPRCLTIKGRTDEALKVLNKLAKLNGRRLPKNLTIINPINTASSTNSTKKLRSVRWAAKRMIVTMATGYGVGFVYYGVQLNEENLNFNLYFTVVANALMEFPAVIVGSVLSTDSRLLFSLSSVIAGVSSILCIVFAKKKKKPEHSWAHLGLEAVGFTPLITSGRPEIIYFRPPVDSGS